jgi:hypothetical protein
LIEIDCKKVEAVRFYPKVLSKLSGKSGDLQTHGSTNPLSRFAQQNALHRFPSMKEADSRKLLSFSTLSFFSFVLFSVIAHGSDLAPRRGVLFMSSG